MKVQPSYRTVSQLYSYLLSEGRSTMQFIRPFMLSGNTSCCFETFHSSLSYCSYCSPLLKQRLMDRTQSIQTVVRSLQPLHKRRVTDSPFPSLLQVSRYLCERRQAVSHSRGEHHVCLIALLSYIMCSFAYRMHIKPLSGSAFHFVTYI